jgi:hypothetical protein
MINRLIFLLQQWITNRLFFYLTGEMRVILFMSIMFNFLLLAPPSSVAKLSACCSCSGSSLLDFFRRLNGFRILLLTNFGLLVN